MNNKKIRITRFAPNTMELTFSAAMSENDVTWLETFLAPIPEGEGVVHAVFICDRWRAEQPQDIAESSHLMQRLAIQFNKLGRVAVVATPRTADAVGKLLAQIPQDNAQLFDHRQVEDARAFAAHMQLPTSRRMAAE